METDISDNKQDRPWLFKKGQSGNPAGRPKGSIGLKTWAKEYLASMTEEERMDFMDGIPKTDIWKMAEGNPHNTSDEKVEVILPQPLDDVRKDDSIQEDKAPQEEN